MTTAGSPRLEAMAQEVDAKRLEAAAKQTLYESRWRRWLMLEHAKQSALKESDD